VSTVRSCRLAQFTRAAWYRKSTARDQAALAMRIRDLAYARPRFGYHRITVLLRREGWPVNRKRVRRLYRLQGLQLRMQVRRRKHMCLHRGPVPTAARQYRRLRDLGLVAPIAVNLSGRNLHDVHLPDRIRMRLRDAHVLT
jgi:transposase InsO family protein